MTLASYPPDRLPRVASRLLAEFAPYPGRFNLLGRCLLSSTLVIIISMTLQVPLLGLSLIVAFYVTQSNVVLTRLIGVLFIAGTTAAVVVVLLLFKVAYGYPLPRIVVAYVLLFICVYLMRAMKIGVMFYVIGLLVIYTQTFADFNDQSESVVRTMLWIWVAANYSIALALLINTLLLPAEPVLQLKAEMRRQLDDVTAVLEHAAGDRASVPAIDVDLTERGMLTMQKLLRFATMRDPDYRQHQAAHLACIAAVSRLHRQACYLAGEPGNAGDRDALRALAIACSTLADAIAAGRPFQFAAPEQGGAHPTLAAPALEIRDTLEALSDRSQSTPSAESSSNSSGLLNPDAFTNPVYPRFALKVVLAVLIGYLFYMAVDWQGIHTVMLTCLVLAQPGLGASTRRGELRIVGAALGSALALFVMVFVIPHLDGIVGLLLTCVPVLALAAWMQAGSERISYAGTQVMFTFSLALLEQFGPATDLTEVRDRMVGIALGIGLSLLIYTVLWPEAEGQLLRQRCAALLRHLARLMSPQAASSPVLKLATIREHEDAWADLADCEDMLARVALEPGWQQNEGEHERLTLHLQVVLARTRQIMMAADAFENEQRAQERALSPATTEWISALRAEVIAGLQQYADVLAGHPLSVHAVAFGSPSAALMRSVTPGTAQRDVPDPVADSRLLGLAQTLVDRVASLPVDTESEVEAVQLDGAR